MRYFRYREDRLPVLIFALYAALDLCVFLFVDSLLFLVAWFALGIIPKACIAAWNHHHQHLMTFRSPLLNRALELVYTFHTGITTHTWVLHHVVGHHRFYLDQEKDPSRWKRKSGEKMGNLEYSLSVMLTAYPRAFAYGRKYKKYLPAFLAMTVLSGALLIAATIYRPWAALFVYILPMTTALFFTAQATYKHHSGLPTGDEFGASTNILHPVYNIATGNLGYHTAHHHKCGVHWSKLPELHDEIAHRIPAHCMQKAPWPWSWMGSDPIPSANPGKA